MNLDLNGEHGVPVSETIRQRFSVPFEYAVSFTRSVFSPGNAILRDSVGADRGSGARRLLFVIEDVLLDHYPGLKENITQYCRVHADILQPAAEPQVFAGGEPLKSADAVFELCALFNRHALCRHSFVCIVGGGAFLDAVGFAAAIVHRGIRQIRFPTTVLSQNDSGVGVKNAINMYGQKNYIGTFAPPFAVINDFDFLKSLSDRDWVAGVPEAFKVAMIKDADFFHWLCEHTGRLAARDAGTMEALVKRCAALHLAHIATSGDPFEFGSARPLDFGHWAAHKLEMLARGALRHGEAVAIGILLDTYYAVQKKMVEAEVLAAVEKSFAELNLPLWHDAMAPDRSGNYPLLEGIEEFRAHLGGELHVTFPNGLGCKIEVPSLDPQIITQGIAWMKKRYA
jgi:3-dehydroquinate synthase